jgi:hypothetical protein
MTAAPLPPQRYRALRARYNALLVTLYERTGLTLREIAAAAGHTERAVQMLVREFACRPRNARACRPGTDVSVRRIGARRLGFPMVGYGSARLTHPTGWLTPPSACLRLRCDR